MQSLRNDVPRAIVQVIYWVQLEDCNACNSSQMPLLRWVSHTRLQL